MTTAEELETQETEIVEEKVYLYKIEPSRLDQLNRSLAITLLSRRCPSCKAKIEGMSEPPPGEKQIKEMAKCCVKKENFIRPEMPLQEIVFRTILAKANKPVLLEELHDAVTDRWYSPINPRNISVQGIKSVLDNDVYYGFVATEKSSDAT